MQFVVHVNSGDVLPLAVRLVSYKNMLAVADFNSLATKIIFCDFSNSQLAAFSCL